MAVNIASAEQTIIDSITTDPERPVFILQSPGVYYSYFTITAHVINPPTGGTVSCTNYEYLGSATIDENGMASFPYVSLSINIPHQHECPRRFSLDVCDADGNVVASAQKDIDTVIHWVPTITWNNPDIISSVTPLSGKQLNAVATDDWGYSIPGTFVYTPAEGTVLSEGIHTLHVDFIPDDTATYSTASADVIINVLDPTLPPETSVPEFPSVVVPVVAALGMITIFGRRKE